MKKIFVTVVISLALIGTASAIVGQTSSGLTVKGKVFLTDKEHPIVGALISLIPVPESKNSSEIGAVKTDEKGDYKFDNVPQGKYTISIKSYYKNQEDVPCKFLLGKTRNPILNLVVMQEKGQFVQHVMTDAFSIKGTKEITKDFDVTCRSAFGQ